MQKVHLLRLMPFCVGLIMLAAYFCQYPLITSGQAVRQPSTYGVNSVIDILISEHREKCKSLSDCYWTSVNTTCRTAGLIQDSMERAEHADFFYLILILRRCRIVKRNRQAALLSGFSPVQIIGRLDVDGQSFVPIGLHETGRCLWLVAHKTALHLLSKDDHD